MKQRRIIVIIGGVALLLLIGAVGVAVYFMHALEKENNRMRSLPAREGREEKDRRRKMDQAKAELEKAVKKSDETELTNEIEDTPVTEITA